MLAPLLADVMGIQSLPAALSIVWFTIVLPTTCERPQIGPLAFVALISCQLVGEPIALKLRRTQTPKYLPVQLFTGFVFLAAAICMLFLRVWAVTNKSKGSEAKQIDPYRRAKHVRTRWTTVQFESVQRAFQLTRI
jgi:hypothetical protein